jgi:hypothetical protein
MKIAEINGKVNHQNIDFDKLDKITYNIAR